MLQLCEQWAFFFLVENMVFINQKETSTPQKRRLARNKELARGLSPEHNAYKRIRDLRRDKTSHYRILRSPLNHNFSITLTLNIRPTFFDSNYKAL